MYIICMIEANLVTAQEKASAFLRCELTETSDTWDKCKPFRRTLSRLTAMANCTSQSLKSLMFCAHFFQMYAK